MRSLSTRARLRLLIYGLLIPLALLPGGCLVRTSVYPGALLKAPPPPPPPLQEIALSLPSGRHAIGWLARPEGSPTAPAVLFCHGNGENLGSLLASGLFPAFTRLGCPVLAVDYPGYGRSPGKPSETGAVEAAVSGLDWLACRYPGRAHAVCGWSLGAAVAIQAARARPRGTDGLILLSPWTSLADAAAAHYPRWLTRILLRERYASLEAAADIRVPVLVMHGEGDTVIPPEQGRRLAGAITPEPRWALLPGTGHNDLLSDPAAWAGIAAFLGSLSP